MRRKVYIVALLIFIIDQITKQLIIRYMTLGYSKKLISNFLYITYSKNQGAAWGIFSNYSFILIIIALITLIYLNKAIERLNLVTYLIIAYGLVVGGLLGNLIDRLLYGYVIDFIDVYPLGYDFPVFNVSDIAIVIGFILLGYKIVVKGEKNDVFF